VWGGGALLFGLGSGDRKFVARPGQETREREREREKEGEKECAKKEKLLQLVMQLLLLLLSFFFSFFLFFKKVVGTLLPCPPGQQCSRISLIFVANHNIRWFLLRSVASMSTSVVAAAAFFACHLLYKGSAESVTERQETGTQLGRDQRRERERPREIVVDDISCGSKATAPGGRPG
jgi:hypothetical protein